MQHISSKLALEGVTESLVSQAAKLSDGDLDTVGTDLLGVADVLRGEAVLRRTLSEATTSTDARVGMVGALFDGKIHPAAVALTADAVGRSWAGGADLRDGIERLGRTALFLGAERTGQLDEVEDQLFRFGRIVEANPQLSVLLDDPTADPAGRKALVGSLLDGKANTLTARLLSGLATATQHRSFSRGIAELVEQAADRKNEVVGSVQSAIELDDSQRDRLAAALTKMYGRPVALHVQVDPQLQGGMRVTVGDEVIDGSIAGRLAALKRKMAG